MNRPASVSSLGQIQNIGSKFRIDGKHAVITGGGRGIGRASTIALSEAGAHVYPLARSAADVEEVCDQVRCAGGRATPLVADVTLTGDRQRVFSMVPRVDVLVNGAGTNVPEPMLEVSEETLGRVLDLNVRAAFLVAQTAARKMIEHGSGGVIINISSQMGHVGATNRSVYCMTKHAIEGLTKAMAVELAPHGVRVNSVAPTFIETSMTKPFLADPQFRKWVLDRMPIGRLGQEEDVVGAIVFLASSAAVLVTGTSLVVDGGWTAQ